MLPVLAKQSVKSQRRVSEVYDPARASTFRAQLDRRLYDRYHGAVAWEVAPQPTQTPAA
jgi:hypothetical protein